MPHPRRSRSKREKLATDLRVSSRQQLKRAAVLWYHCRDTRAWKELTQAAITYVANVKRFQKENAQ